MITQGKHIDINHAIADGIHQTVLICDASAPKTLLIAFQGFGLPYSSEGMVKDICKQRRYPFHDTLVACFLPVFQIFLCFGKKLYFHISSSLMTRPRPFFMSSWPCRIISAIAGEDIKYSVSSIACFLAVNFLRYFTAFCIKLSSSAMMLNSRKSSAVNCNAVLIPRIYDFGGKGTKKVKRLKG